ncbi:hypothetical protein AV955_gp087 [Diadromus pulchellus ascovirus 4a]|uniref:Complete DpAV4 genome n=1 Tax=Diadromus pulchellus ascovirus 4a TaxID=158683 RepID=F2NZ16_9VIRU|nr:hypothetical protein AV955_gp087 [Diadromus pulchellus ascovirus 4a]CCA61444.1 unnamed protein product [Diadromus pulchellus ascovirus 4a]
MTNLKDKHGNEYTCDFRFEGSDTLVMSGGALKCISFLGAICAVGSIKDVKFKNFAGTSCGAIVSALLAVGFSPFQIFLKMVKAYSDTMNITRVLDQTIAVVAEMFKEKGFEDTATFRDVFVKTGNRLAFVATNVSKMREEVFSTETNPNMEVITAIRLSSALPIVFSTTYYKNDIYVDGIFFDNFPLKLAKLFPNRKKVVGITTFGSHYDNRLRAFYAKPSIYKILMLFDNGKYFCVTKKEALTMFVTGYMYVFDGRSRNRRRRSSCSF